MCVSTGLNDRWRRILCAGVDGADANNPNSAQSGGNDGDAEDALGALLDEARQSAANAHFVADLIQGCRGLAALLGTDADLTPENLCGVQVVPVAHDIQLLVFVLVRMAPPSVFPRNYAQSSLMFVPLPFFETIHFSQLDPAQLAVQSDHSPNGERWTLRLVRAHLGRHQGFGALNSANESSALSAASAPLRAPTFSTRLGRASASLGLAQAPAPDAPAPAPAPAHASALAPAPAFVPAAAPGPGRGRVVVRNSSKVAPEAPRPSCELDPRFPTLAHPKMLPPLVVAQDALLSPRRRTDGQEAAQEAPKSAVGDEIV